MTKHESAVTPPQPPRNGPKDFTENVSRLKHCQEQVEGWRWVMGVAYWPPDDIFKRLAEELGEVGRELNDSKPKKDSEGETDLETEIGDMLFTLCCLANSRGLDMDRGFQKALEKAYGDPRWKK